MNENLLSWGWVTFTPKSVMDRGNAESLADFAAGLSCGPFKTQKELINSLHRESSKVLSKTKAKRKLSFMLQPWGICTHFRPPK